jgi:hypothetical protein
MSRLYRLIKSAPAARSTSWIRPMAKFSFAHRARTSWPRWCRDGHTRAPIAEHLARTSGRPMEVIDCGYSAWSDGVVIPPTAP